MTPHRARPLVLAVDDVEDARVLLKVTLPLLGFDVAVAGSGVEALEQARALGPDIIVLDICMPRLVGYETLARLQQDPRLAHIPVVAFTAKADDKEQAIRAGFAAWCSKPCPPDKLATLLREVLAASRPTASAQGVYP